MTEYAGTRKESLLGVVPDRDLPRLQRSLLLSTSLYEGFGLPPLEALPAAARHCLCTTSLPEVRRSALF
jgi:glycosyltransferase involved in cell wall biosynthesis